MKYPISDELKQAIESLFENPNIGFETVGARRILPPEWYREHEDDSISIEERAKLLRKLLEGNLANMAAESEEYECAEETARLRSEGMATLIALRELFLHLPEAFEN